MLAEDRAEEVEDGKSVFETGSLKSLSMKKRTRASSSTLVLQPLSETLPRRKVVVLGDGAIGKTSLLGVLCGLPVSPEYTPTVFDNKLITYQIDGKLYEIAMWDTAGQDDYARLRPLSYPDTDVFMVCFSIDEPQSFENVVEKWIPEVKHHMPYAHIVLVGLREDLRRNHTRQHKCVPPSKGRELEGSGLVDKYIECSALQDAGTWEVLERVARCAIMPPKRSRRGNQCSIV